MSSARFLIETGRLKPAPAYIALLMICVGLDLFAAEHRGQITFTGLPVPGATITATRGGTSVSATSDPQGFYRLTDLGEGAWTIRIEMLGFTPLQQEITIAEASAPVVWELQLMPFDEIKRIAISPETGSPPNERGGRIQPAQNQPAPNQPLPPETADPDQQAAADGFLINGSVNNGAASPFAQPRAFGNNRTGQRSLYNGGAGFNLGSSAWNARPYSFSGQKPPKPDYTDLYFSANFGGPLRFGRALRNGPVFFVGYLRTSDHNATTQTALVPTMSERSGDLSQRLNASGEPVSIVDPVTGQPFAGSRIPSDRISPQAAALLNLYPQPNVQGNPAYNYQAAVRTSATQHSVQSRFTQTVSNRTMVFGTVNYQQISAEDANLFGFVAGTDSSALNATINWSRRFSQFFTLRGGYRLIRASSRTTPFFAYRRNVSGEAGITGNNQEPVNWGPPSLTFASGLAALADAQPAGSVNTQHELSLESVWRTRGGHTVTFGGAVRPQRLDVDAQQNPRGGFGFTGGITGSDFADFLLGVPASSSIAFGNADKDLRASAMNLYVSDDWRLSPSLTINAGVRWEYEGPFSERLGRLANLEVTPRFDAATPVTEAGADALLNADYLGVQPRLAVSWRPIPASSLVVRAGYGIYRNTNVYRSIALQMAQQPPFSKALSVQNSAQHPLTLANGFVTPQGEATNTFAVDPDFRVGAAHNWQISAQRDLPMSLTIIATYLGTRGTHLMQQFAPNTYPLGAINPCTACPNGFVYLISDGRSLRNAGQLQLRRRLRAGLTATFQYTLSKATDDAAAFNGADLNGALVAQDWQNLDAEYGLSAFDQRHAVAMQFEYAPVTLKNWTFTGQLTSGSGLPVTPAYLAQLQGTVITGGVRPNYTGRPIEGQAPGSYANPEAFAPPAPGEWGNARRNSITGPAQFTFNAGLMRTFLVGPRLSFDWRVDAQNVLNRVVYSSIVTTVGSPQFGYPNRANTMRKIQTSVRMRF